jgi:hypothetical protein
MVRKNTFHPEIFKKDKLLETLVHRSSIRWTEAGTDMSGYLRILKQYNQNEEDPFNFSSYKDHYVIAKASINQKLKLLSDDGSMNQFMYLITNDDYSLLYISINVLHPMFWYIYETRNDFFSMYDKLYQAYNKTEYSFEFNRNTRGFGGTENMLGSPVESLENFFTLNRYTEILLWGSKWKDNPYRDLYLVEEMSSAQHLIYATQAMKQINNQTYHINVRTEYSKSIITIEKHDDGFIINVHYNSVFSPQIKKINDVLNKEYPLDVPIDVIISIINMPYISHLGLLKLNPLTSYNFSMAALIANTPLMTQEVIKETKNIMATRKLDKETRDYSVLFLKMILSNVKIDKILHNNGVLNFIDTKMEELRKGDVTYKDGKKLVFDKIDETVILVKMDDPDFITYFKGIIDDILLQCSENTI